MIRFRVLSLHEIPGVVQSVGLVHHTLYQHDTFSASCFATLYCSMYAAWFAPDRELLFLSGAHDSRS